MFDVSRVITGASVPRGAAVPVRQFSGARCARVIEAPRTRIRDHAHDWPVLSLFVLGRCERHHGNGSTVLCGPSAVLHPANTSHSSSIDDAGFEQIDIQFDPDWLRECPSARSGLPISLWDKGSGALRATRLRNLWLDPSSSEDLLRSETAKFLNSEVDIAVPSWAATIRQKLERDVDVAPAQLAAEAGLSLPWFLQAYKTTFGEGLPQTVQRLRVERAVTLLAANDSPAAEIAVEAGFYDQSHMIRIFKKLLRRTPSVIAAEQAHLIARVEAREALKEV